MKGGHIVFKCYNYNTTSSSYFLTGIMFFNKLSTGIKWPRLRVYPGRKLQPEQTAPHKLSESLNLREHPADKPKASDPHSADKIIFCVSTSFSSADRSNYSRFVRGQPHDFGKTQDFCGQGFTCVRFTI